MAISIWVPNQSDANETRVPLVPAVAKKLIAMGSQVTIESGVGLRAHHPDAAYVEAGASIATNGDVWSNADLVTTVGPPRLEQIGEMADGSILIGLLAPFENLRLFGTLAEKGVTAFSMEFIPRISRAQTMDVLSSQASLGGYMAAVIGARACPKMFPMMMTAAGTIAPARVFIIGAGVAGLQAIATAKRLGAVVEAYDVRPVVKEQVLSLGARFVELPMTAQEAQTSGGYARELTDAERAEQQELMTKHIVGADVVITTAAVFGKAPPMLIPESVVGQMRPGSVIVDLAADVDAGRGNCELTQPDQQVTTASGVLIDGTTNLSALVPVHASQAYANNMLAFVKELFIEKQIQLNLQDEIQNGAAITHDGKIVNERIAKAVETA